MGEREDASVVRRIWELIEARRGDEAASRFGEDLVVYWVHTKETFLGGRNFIDMNRSYPDWDNITIDRVVAKGSVVVSEIAVTTAHASSGPHRFSTCATGRSRVRPSIGLNRAWRKRPRGALRSRSDLRSRAAFRELIFLHRKRRAT